MEQLKSSIWVKKVCVNKNVHYKYLKVHVWWLILFGYLHKHKQKCECIVLILKARFGYFVIFYNLH